MDPNFPMNSAKRRVAESIAKVIGWNGLWYDTYPSARFNIWHFPIDFRAPTRETVLEVEA